MRSACKLRKYATTELFKNEIFGVAQSISLDSMSLYQGVKADLLKCLSTAVKPSNIQYNSALTIYLFGIINVKANMNFPTFKEVADYLYSHILSIGKVLKDVMWYVIGTLKEYDILMKIPNFLLIFLKIF